MKYVWVLIFAFSTALSAQELEGKWISAKDSATVSVARTLVLDFQASKLDLYDFNKPIASHNYYIEDSQLIVDGVLWGNLNFVSDNRIRIRTKDQSNRSFSTDYVRLQPTKTSFSLEDLYEFTYYYSTPQEKDTLFLGIQLQARPEKLKRYEIEQIDSTWLLTSYKFGVRFKSMPILAAYENFIKLDGLPNSPYTLRAGRIYELPPLDEKFLEELNKQ